MRTFLRASWRWLLVVGKIWFWVHIEFIQGVIGVMDFEPFWVHMCYLDLKCWTGFLVKAGKKLHVVKYVCTCTYLQQEIVPIYSVLGLNCSKNQTMLYKSDNWLSCKIHKFHRLSKVKIIKDWIIHKIFFHQERFGVYRVTLVDMYIHTARFKKNVWAISTTFPIVFRNKWYFICKP